ncbi:adenine deaminase [uncultured Sphaerochaeta sp.]|uniref:adenine deaminase n=1 Tax=uncultured Sphaerochaeta sp. TaxID=886478 RepID=UPI002A0A1BF8|nr:adenine deaminase [uncultured Sphaerochaeta sp.]
MDVSLIEVALGKRPADTIIKDGSLVNVHTGEIYQTDIAVSHGRIATIGPILEGAYGPDTMILDAKGLYLAPGFMDAHIHIESSMLTYTEFSKMVVKHGTTAVATDLMEVTIVSGLDGMKEVLNEAGKTPVHLYYPIPAFMDEDQFQTTGSTLHPSMMEDLITLPQAVGLAEVLAYPILAGSQNSASMLDLAERYHKTAEGHAPGLLGEALNAYASAGINSDHESTSKEEALQKLRCGLNVLMREGSASTDLEACLKVLVENHISSRFCSMVSDDIDALHISTYGHLDHKVRMAIKAGVDPVSAIQMVTLNPATNFHLEHERGSLTPGKVADIVFLSSLEACKVEQVMSDGNLVVKQGNLCIDIPAYEYAPVLLNTVTLSKVIEPADLLLTVDPEATSAHVHVIGASKVSLLTEAMEADLPVIDGVVQADTAQDVLHIACIERYGKNGNIGKAFVHGFGLTHGAIALSVGHDHHNISVIGSNAADMACAVNRIGDLQGGFVLVDDGVVIEEIALPICGLLSPDDGEVVAAKLKKMIEVLKSFGCDMPSPNVTLSFLTLIFIPAFGITDKGLFDVFEQKIIDAIIQVN